MGSGGKLEGAGCRTLLFNGVSEGTLVCSLLFPVSLLYFYLCPCYFHLNFFFFFFLVGIQSIIQDSLRFLTIY